MKIRLSLLIFALVPLVALSQTRVVDNKGTLKTIDESKWMLGGSNIYLKEAGNVGIGTNAPKAKLHVKGSTLFETLSIADMPTGGSIGTKEATVDIYTSINLNQTTAGQTLSLPAPTNPTAGRMLQVNNIGTASVTIGTITIDAQQTAEFVWNGTQWAVPTAVPQLISGSKTFSAAPSAPSLKLSDNTNQLLFNTGTANTGTLAWTPTAPRTIILPNISGTVALISDITSPSLYGDVTGTVDATVLTSIQGKTINAPSPTDKQVLQYDASTSTWKPSSASTFYSLNNLTASAQLLAIGTAGTAPAWNSLTSTHTLDIPMASTASVTAGLLSNADWTIFNTKVSSVAAGSQKITIGGTATAPTVDVDPSKLGAITLATTTTGTDVSVNGSPANLGGTLTLNVPDASATARGVITTGTQTIAGNKIFSGSTTVFGSGEGGTPTATFIRGPQAGGTGTPGANLYIQASNGTGAGGSGNIIFQTGSAATVSVPTVSNVVNQTFPNLNIQTLSYTVPSGGTNQVLMVEVNLPYAGISVSGITYNGAPLSLLKYVTSYSSRVEIWYLVAPSAGASKDIVVTLSGYGIVNLTAMTWTNVNQATPFGTVASTDNGTNTVAGLSAVSSLGQVVLDFLTTTSSSIAATGGQSVLASYNNGTAFYNTSGYKTATAGTTAISYSLGASSNYGYMAFAIQSSTSGGGNALSDALTINNTGNTVIAGGKSLALADASGNLVSLKAPSSVGTYVLTLPAGQGGTGQALLNDGSGGLSWGIPANSYALPIATSGTLGGVKVGSGLNVDGSGVISIATSGTVSSVSTAVANNGVTATWATSTTTPALTIGLGAITPTSVNGLTLAAQTTGFTVAGGTTTSKTLTVNNNLVLSGTDGSTLNIGGGGTLGTNAYTSTAYAPLASPAFTGTVTNNGSFAGTAVLPAANGGTGQNSYAIGDLLYASAATTLSKLTAAATGSALISGGVSAAPSWGKIGLTTHVSGVLPVLNGGTGMSSIGANSLLYASAANTISALTSANNGILVTSGSGVPSISNTVGGALTMPALNLSGTSNQLVLQSGGVTGTLTWTPSASNKVITLPNTTGTVALTSDVTNITLSGDVTSTSSTTTVVGKINGISLAALGTGILKNTTSTGVPSIAVAADFPTLNQNTTGTATNVTGIVAVANGGTGSSTKDWVDLTTAQTSIAGAKTWTALGTFSAGLTATGGTINLNASTTYATNIGNGTNNLILLGTADMNQSGTASTRIGNTTGTLTLEGGAAATAIQIGNGATAHGIQIGTGAAVNALVLGSTNTTSSTIIQGGSGTDAITLDPNTGGSIVIGDAAGTGDIILGRSSAAQIVNVGTGAGASTVNIANGIAGNTVSIANGVNTTAQTVNIANGLSGASSTVNILSGIGTAGTGAINLGDNPRVTTIDVGNYAPAAARTTTIAGGTSAVVDQINIGTDVATVAGGKTINIGTGATTAAGGNTIHIGDGTPTGSGTNLVTIGSTVGASATTIQAGTGGVKISNALAGNSATPSIATSVGAGTTPTVKTVTGTNLAGIIAITTGGTAPTINAVVATITYANGVAFSSGSYVILTPANSVTSALAVGKQVFVSSSTTTGFVLSSGGTALSNNAAYKWYYMVVGQ